ncbi:MAG: penicillin-binding protein 2 [Synergistaceae bacterium]|nr:penicillin-binding protein 2 [Synergistaceae bacterium]
MQRISQGNRRTPHFSKAVWFFAYTAILVLALETAWVTLRPDYRIINQSHSQYWANVSVSATRGSIMDRNGSALAVSVPTASFFIDPKSWETKNAHYLARYFGEDAARKFSRQQPGRFYWLKRNVKMDLAAEIKGMQLPGLYTKTEYVRNYPNGAMAFHLLGYCDIDGYGQAGVEHAWNHILFSPPRTRFMTRSGGGNMSDPMNGMESSSKGTSGSLKLTVNTKIQEIVEKNLIDAAEKAQAKWAAGICVNPRTGEVLAMASYPAADPNDRNSFRGENVRRNNAISRNYEPGSVFKPIMMSIAMEAGAANKNTSHFLCKGTIPYADKIIKCNNRKAHGSEDLMHVLMNSCNVGMSIMSRDVKREQAYGLLKQYGFGERSGIEMTGEEKGQIKPPEEWLGTVPANVFIGQGISVTALQEIMAISAIANGGALMKPYIVKEVTDHYGKTVHKGKPRIRAQVMSSETAAFIRSAMGMVVAEGGGQKAKSDKVPIAGKTGTAQVSERGRYQEGRYVGSFVGFWPVENPKYAMLISIGEPQGAYYGGVISAPVFKAIVEEIETKIPKEYSSEVSE